MKYIISLLLIACIAVACHKSHSSAPPDIFPINGLTSVKYKPHDDSMGYNFTPPHVTWNFSGTNPIIALPPVADTSLLGFEQMSFTGKNATGITYSGGWYSLNWKIGISYNSAQTPDTLTYTLDDFITTKYVFEYASGKVAKITQVSSSGPPYDTLMWAYPSGYYYYFYNGDNISQIVVGYGGAPSYGYDTMNYTAGTLKNNFAGSYPVFFLLESIFKFNEFGDFPTDLPYYMNANVIDSASGLKYRYVTDNQGRILQQVSKTPINTGIYRYDTVFYNY